MAGSLEMLKTPCLLTKYLYYDPETETSNDEDQRKKDYQRTEETEKKFYNEKLLLSIVIIVRHCIGEQSI